MSGAPRSLPIPEDEIIERFVRATGPGGQNVNKVATAVELRFDVVASRSISELARAALLFGGRLNKKGILIIQAHRFATQDRNRADARARLADIIEKASVPPKLRRKTRVPRSSRAKRLDGKKHRSDVKKGRARPADS